jgi:type VI secretion system VgrG family protein
MTQEIDDALVFGAEPLPAGSLLVRRLRGREGLSRLYRFTLLLETRSRDYLDPEVMEALVASRAFVAFGEDEEHPIHGLVESVELAEASAPGRVFYRVTLVPRAWSLSRTFRSRVFQDMTVPEIVDAVLAESGLQNGKGYALKMVSSHPKREYTVQYQETDLAFLSRLMEYEGIFYFFEHGEKGEKMIVGDSNYAFGTLEGRESLPFVPPAGARTTAETGISSLSERLSVVERSVEVRDYNYRTPAVQLASEAPVDQEGRGQRQHYGEHFKTPDDGARLAKIRAEELAVRKRVHRARADVRGLHAGQRFGLTGHPNGALDQEYFVVEVRHAAEQAAPGGGEATRGYRQKLVAIPMKAAFRPPRETPWPRITGLLHAKIDGTQTTMIDEHGRYKVLLPFDSATAGSGRASRWIRMAQPLSGPSGKMHFPLDVGTEVTLAHVDGDPDRPIIAGAIPNHETPSPVVAANALQSVITTRSGIRMTFDDLVSGS